MNNFKKTPKNLGSEKKSSPKTSASKSSTSMKNEYGEHEKNTRGSSMTKKSNSKMNTKMGTERERNLERESGTGARNFENREKRTSDFDKSYKNDCNCRCNDKKCK